MVLSTFFNFSLNLAGVPSPGNLLSPVLLHCRQILYQLSHQGSPRILEWAAYPFSRGSFWPRNWTLHPLGCPLGSGGSGSFLTLVFQSLGHSSNVLFLNSVFQWWTQRHCYSGRSVLYCSSKHLRGWGLEIKGFHDGSVGKESTDSSGDSGSITRLGRSLEEGMATHSSILAWEILWTMESAGLQSTGSQRVRHDFVTKEQQQSLEITPSGLPMVS